MDIARPDQSRQKRIRRVIYGGIAVLAVGAISLGLSRLKPAAPGVDRSTVLVDTVKRGEMIREVRGQGTLVPEDTRWIPATTQGRVERIRLRPGTRVTADSVILDLSNPQLDQELRDAELRANGAEAGLANLRVQARNDELAQEAATANIEAEYKKAALAVEANEQLSTKGLVPDMTAAESLAALKAHLAKRGFGDIEVNMTGGYDPTSTPVDSAIIRAGRAVYRRHGIDPVIIPRNAGSWPGYIFTGDPLRLPASHFGLGHGGGAHAPDRARVDLWRWHAARPRAHRAGPARRRFLPSAW
jgi:hypothetical protein